MADLEPVKISKTKKIIIYSAIGLGIAVIAVVAINFFFRTTVIETTKKTITISDLSAISQKDASSLSLEPFIVVCDRNKDSAQKILIAEINLSFKPSNAPDIQGKMFDIRSQILESLQNTCPGFDKSETEKTLKTALAPYMIENVGISRFELK
jgi:flagellar basal body-associated protein FliL